MITKIHYVIKDGADGSVYLELYESEKLAEFAESRDEGWAEPAFGSIAISSESPVTIEGRQPITAIKYFFEEAIFGLDEAELADFINEFFPDGLPEFEVEKNGSTVFVVDGQAVALMYSTESAFDFEIRVRRKISDASEFL
jgi:hypothetical protein